MESEYTVSGKWIGQDKNESEQTDQRRDGGDFGYGVADGDGEKWM